MRASSVRCAVRCHGSSSGVPTRSNPSGLVVDVRKVLANPRVRSTHGVDDSRSRRAATAAASTRPSCPLERLLAGSVSMTEAVSPLPDVSGLTIGVLGGTGDQGRGLAYRFALAGLRVLLGSRDPDRAASVAGEIGLGVRGLGNADCALASDILLVAVPWEAHEQTLRSLQEQLVGKLVIDCVNPLGFDARGAYALPVTEGSATEQAATLLPQSRVVGAFHHVSAKLLADPSVHSVDLDILVVGDDREATDLVQVLAGLVAGMRGVYAGRLRNAHQIEALTANLISVNRRYKAHAGVRVTDI